MRHIGEVARNLRKQAGLTLIEVASYIHQATGEKYDNGNLSKFERGIFGISPRKLEALASSLGTTVSEIYRLVETEEALPSPPSTIERLLGEIRVAASKNLSPAEESALADGLRAQLAWLKARQGMPAVESTQIYGKPPEEESQRVKAFADKLAAKA